MSIQDTEMSQGRHPGYNIGRDMLITMASITVTDRLRINGARAGRLHGYKKNGKDLNSLPCVEDVDHLAMADRLGLEVRVAVSSVVAI
jgi:hypothetical protein